MKPIVHMQVDDPLAVLAVYHSLSHLLLYHKRTTNSKNFSFSFMKRYNYSSNLHYIIINPFEFSQTKLNTPFSILNIY